MTSTRRLPWLSKVLGPRMNEVAATSVRAEPIEIPTPVDRDRIAHYLHSRGYTFILDDDGDLTGIWDGNRFWFLLLGTDHDIVQVRGRWHRALAPASRPLALQVINDWNRDRIWPKVYLRDEGEVLGLYTELTVDLGPGATKDQLDQVVACGLSTAIQFFSSMSAELPLEFPDSPELDEP
jgi:hypothetical protein